MVQCGVREGGGGGGGGGMVVMAARSQTGEDVPGVAGWR